RAPARHDVPPGGHGRRPRAGSCAPVGRHSRCARDRPRPLAAATPPRHGSGAPGRPWTRSTGRLYSRGLLRIARRLTHVLPERNPPIDASPSTEPSGPGADRPLSRAASERGGEHCSAARNPLEGEGGARRSRGYRMSTRWLGGGAAAAFLAMGVTPALAGSLAYLSNLDEASVTVIDTTSLTETATIPLPGIASAIVAGASGTRVYASYHNDTPTG